jgi:hypothetical protein
MSSGFRVFRFRNKTFLQSKAVRLASNPQPGGPFTCIYHPVASVYIPPLISETKFPSSIKPRADL